MTSMQDKLARYARKIRVMIRLADELRQLATDPEVSFGCVVFPVDCSAVDAIGYNGTPAGIDELPRPALDTPGGSGFCHAEMNALTKWNTRSAGPSLMFVHSTPCKRCAGQIINARKVVGLIHEDPYVGDGGAGLELVRQKIVTLHRSDIEEACDLGEGAAAAAILRYWRSLA